jgi:hypothetical protein
VADRTIERMEAFHKESGADQDLVVATPLWRQLSHTLRANPLKESFMVGPNNGWIAHAMVVGGLHRVHEVCQGGGSGPRARGGIPGGILPGASKARDLSAAVCK